MTTVRIALADPRSPSAQEALTAYSLEVREAAGLRELDVESALRDVDGFTGERGFFLLATAEGAAVGCVGLRAWSNEEAEIKRMWVAVNRRGSGLATQLLAQTEDHARALGFTRLLLDTHGSLTAALRFYSRHGYRPVERYNDNPDATHFFAKDLEVTSG